MPRPIDADALLQLYENDGALNLDSYKVPVPVVRQNIIDAQTLDYAPVRHGEWGAAEIVGYDGIHAVYAVPCSACKEYAELYRARYCPNCGAKMGENNERE